MKKFLLAAGSIILICFLPGLKLAAQTTTPVPVTAKTNTETVQSGVIHGHEYRKAEVNFTDIANYQAAHPKPLVRKPMENEDDDARPAVSKLFPSGVHMRTTEPHSPFSSSHLAFLPVSPAPVDTFESTESNNTSIPPDTHGDVNGTYCVTAINQSIQIQTRTGAIVSTVLLDNFWSAVLGSGEAYDPRVFFDRYTDRWYMETDANPESDTSSIMLAISKTNDPTGGWYLFIVNVSESGASWVDYPTMGYNKTWIVLGGNPFSNSGSGASVGASVFIFDKALLLSGTSATYTRFDKDSSFGICPAVMYDTTDYNEFAAESWDGTNSIIRLWKISGPVLTPTLTTVGYPSSAPLKWNYQGNNGNDFAPQTGTTDKIQTNDDRIYDLKYMNGNLWCSHNVFLPYSTTTNPTRCSIQWWQFDTLANPIQLGLIDDATATNFYYFPGIAVNQYNDVLIGMSTSSAATHVNAAYAVHLHTDPTDSIRPIYIFRHGQKDYYQTYGGGRDRWGDYSQSSLDTDNTCFWTIQETVPNYTGAIGNSLWDTWWAYIYICEKPAASITPVGATNVCAPNTVVLDANTGTDFTYQWELGGTAITGATSSTYTATVSGTYNVIVYNSTTCDSTSLPVVVTINSLPAAITGTMAFCSGSTTDLTDATTGGTWSSTTTSVATISTSGVVTGVSTGTSTISYTLSTGCSITAIVTVNAGPTATITPAGATTFCTGGSVVLDANTGTGLTYQWQLGGVNIVGATSSSYTASTGGSYTVIVYQGVCATTSSATVVTVQTAPVVTPIGGATTNVCNGQTITLTDATTGGTWNSGDVSIATVSSGGIVTGASLGTVLISYTITNTCGSIVTSITVTVNVATVVSAISGTLDVCIGGTTPLSDATASGVWSSSNTGVATVSAGGLVTGVSAGTANISYSVTNVTGCASSAVSTVTVSTPFTAVITPIGSTTFCVGGNVVLTATSGTGFTYQWQLGGVNIAGATSSSYTATTGGNYTVIVTDPGGCTSTSAGVTVTESTGFIITPSVSITASLGTIICTTTTPETFTANPVNGGSAPAYQWYVNGAATGTGASYSYTPANGDIVSCTMTSNAPCAFPDTTTNSVMITVSPLLTPSVSITSVHNDSTCTGDTVQFAAIPVNGGTAPTYLWTENGVNVATGPYYIYPPQNGDTLIVTMTSNYPCLSTPIAVSNIFIIHVFNQASNSLSVTVSQSTVLAGLVDTFTAIATGAGSSPSFQWYIDGYPVPGATSYRYITDSLQDGQIVNCEETSSFVCSSPHSIFSGGLTITVLPNSVQQVSNSSSHFTLLPNPNKGDFTIGGTIGLPGDDKVTIVMSDIVGQTIYSKTVTAVNGSISEHISLGNTLASGTYMVTITSGEEQVVFHVTIDK